MSAARLLASRGSTTALLRAACRALPPGILPHA